jgi:hypothetical protein
LIEKTSEEGFTAGELSQVWQFRLQDTLGLCRRAYPIF